MKNTFSTHNFILAILFHLSFPMAGQQLPLNIGGNEFHGQKSLQQFMVLATDPTGKMKVQEALSLPFQPFSGSFELKKNGAYWFRFPIKNTSSDSIHLLLCMDKFTRSDLFYKKKPGEWEHRKGGMWTNYSERSFPLSRFCHPIQLSGGQERTYFLQLSDYFHPGQVKPNFRLLTQAQEKEQRLEAAMQEVGYNIFQGVFFGILALLVFVSFVHFHLHRNQAYLFYAAYAISMFVFYLRSLDLEPPLPLFGDLKAYHANLEAPLGYMSYAFYLQFIRIFLDLPFRLPNLDRFLLGGVATFTALTVIDPLVFQLFGGWQMSLNVHHYVKLPFFVLSLWAIAVIVSQLKSRLAIYILTGVSLLLLPTIFTVVADRLPGVYEGIWSNTARSFTPTGSKWTWYMYDVKVGLLLEMACFLLGLTWKTRQENERIKGLAAAQTSLSYNPAPENGVKTAVPIENPILLKVRETVTENLADEDFNVEKLAKKMAMSRSKLFRNLQSEGINASELIECMRLQQVKTLLESSTLTLSQIADEVGYKSAAQLSRSYKRVFGMPPRGRNGHV